MYKMMNSSSAANYEKNKVSLQEKVQETYKNLSVAEKEKKGDGLMEYIKKVEYGKNSLKIQKKAFP